MSFFRILGSAIQILITATLFSKWSLFINEFAPLVTNEQEREKNYAVWY